MRCGTSGQTTKRRVNSKAASCRCGRASSDKLTGVAAQAAAPVIVEKNNSLTRHFANLPDCEALGFTHTED
jgi:hypothetical protein